MNSNNQNLITNPQARTDRRHEKMQSVLRFLRQHIWSSQNILQQVMKLQSRQATHKTLIQMKELGLTNSHQYKSLGGTQTLWGITSHGQAMAFNPKIKEELINAYFEPSKVSLQNINHQLDLQKLRLIAESDGWVEWVDGDRLGGLEKNAKRPDAIVKNRNSLLLAIECERTFKTQRRYSQILVSYLILLKNNKVSKVVWVMPTKELVERLRCLVFGIKYVVISGQRVSINPEKHHANIHFCSYEDWPNYEQ